MNCHASRALDTDHDAVPEDADLEALFALHRVHQARDHVVLYREGDPPDHVIRVVSGLATRTRHLPDGTRHLIGFAEPGDILGYHPHHAHHDETVEAVFRFRYQTITLDGLSNRLLAQPWLSVALFSAIHRQGRRVEDKFAQRVHMASYRFLAVFLLRLRDLMGETADNVLHLPISRAEIADHLGFTPETASRAFTRLRKQALIETLPRGDIQITNLLGLQQLARVG